MVKSLKPGFFYKVDGVFVEKPFFRNGQMLQFAVERVSIDNIS